MSSNREPYPCLELGRSGSCPDQKIGFATALISLNIYIIYSNLIMYNIFMQSRPKCFKL